MPIIENLELWHSVIKSQKDIENLQADLNALSQWTKENRLSLNIAKCSVTSFNKIRTPVISDYFISDHLLDRKNVFKDRKMFLGVIFDSNLSFSHHINHVVSKASNLVGFIKRTTSDFTDVSAIIYLYKTIVLPTLLYCSQI